ISIKKVGFADDGHDVQLGRTEITVEGTSFQIADGASYRIPLFGEHHARNAAFALTVAELFQIPEEKKQDALLSLEHSAMRFEICAAQNGAIAVNDSYNASPTSMKGAIEVVKKMEGFTSKILVLGDILELGKFSAGMHRKIADGIHSPKI